MKSAKQGIRSRFGPSNSEKLTWGNQEPIWPISAAALGAVPSPRIRYLARHKGDFSAREDPPRKEEEEEEEEEESFSRKTQRPSSRPSQYEHIVRLSTPTTRSSREVWPPHTPQCHANCPVWHVDPRAAKAAGITLRLRQLAEPKATHPDFQSNRQSFDSIVASSQTARASRRLVQLSRPRLKESAPCSERGRPEEPIWTVPRAARRATASARVEKLATPKRLSEDYVPPREPEWSRKNLHQHHDHHAGTRSAKPIQQKGSDVKYV